LLFALAVVLGLRSASDGPLADLAGYATCAHQGDDAHGCAVTLDAPAAGTHVHGAHGPSVDPDPVRGAPVPTAPSTRVARLLALPAPDRQRASGPPGSVDRPARWAVLRVAPKTSPPVS
jgi:hypothetical protein